LLPTHTIPSTVRAEDWLVLISTQLKLSIAVIPFRPKHAQAVIFNLRLNEG
jgi:hypothetical protein